MLPITRPITAPITAPITGADLGDPVAQLFARNEPGADYDFTDFNRTTTWRRNLLTWSEQFDNATAWQANGATITANAVAAPDGTLTADQVVFAGNELDRVQQPPIGLAFGTYTFSCWARVASGSANVRFGDATSLQNVTITTSWQRFSTSFSVSGPNFTWRNESAGGAKTIFIWGAQLERGSVATDYQRITDVTSDFRAAFPDTLFYADTTGATPVTAVEQTVGLILDKSRGLRLGPELVTNGDFSGGSTGWGLAGGVWSVAGGVASTVGGSTGGLTQAITLASGRGYLVTLDISDWSANTVLAEFTGGSTASGGVGPLSNGRYSTVIFANSGNTTLSITKNSAATALSVDNVSVRELPGLHQRQSTAASRAVLRSRYNLLTWSEDFTNAAWVTSVGGTGVSAVKTPNFGTAPDGTQTACRVQLDKGAGTTDSDFARMFQTFTGTNSFRRIWIKTNDASTKTFRLEATGPNFTVTGAWTQISDVASASALQVLLQGTTSTTADFLVWHPELLQSCDAQIPYQRINAATDYATGPQFPTYLEYDGVDDSYASAANLDLSGTDKVTVFAAVTKLSDAARANVLELTADVGGPSGGILLRAPQSSTGQGDFGFFARGGGTLANATTAASFAAPRTAILTATDDIAGDSAALRVNGVVAATDSATDQGTGNFASAQLFLGARSGGTLPFRGRMYRVIVRGAATAAADIAGVEGALNVQAGKVY